MKIYKYDVPDDMVLRYCRVVKELEHGFSASLECARKVIHDQIFEHVGCERSLYRRCDREFNTALNKTLIELTE